MKKAAHLLCFVLAIGFTLHGSAYAADAGTGPRPSRVLNISPGTVLGPAIKPAPKTFSQLAPTTRMSFAELVGDNGNYAAIKKYPAKDKYKVVVDIYHQVVLAYTKDANGRYTVPERYMICTTGGVNNPTPTGTFAAGTHRPRFGMFVNDGVYGQYWTQVVGKIYFHSILYKQRNASTYTVTSYNLLGTRGSHGCIRLLVPDARWIYYHIGPGARVEIRAGSKSDTATAAIKRQLTRPPAPSTRPNVNGVGNTDVWSIAELNNQLSSKNAEAIKADPLSQRGDVYATGGDEAGPISE